MNRRWLTILLTLMGFGVLLGYELQDDYSRISLQEQQRLTSLATALDLNLSEQLSATSRMLELLSEDAPVLLKEKDGVARLNRRMELLSHSVMGIRTLLMVRANGEVIASNRHELLGQNMRGNDRYKTLREGSDPGKLYISAPFETPLGVYTIGLGRITLNAQGEFDGYFLAVLSPDYFGVLLKSLLYAPDMRLTVAHGQGKVIYSTQSTPDIRGVDLSVNPLSTFSRHKTSGSGANFYIDSGNATNELRYVALRTIRPASLRTDHELVVVVFRQASAVLHEWNAAAIHTTILFACVALTVGLGYFAYSRRQIAFERLQIQREEEQKLAQATAKSERFIRTITDAMPDLVAYFDRDLRCQFANKAYLDWYQMTARAMRGTALSDLLGESLFAKNKAHIDKALAGESQHFERFLTKRDGSVGHVLAHYIPDIDENNHVIGFNVLVSDIAALRLAEANLKVASSVFENTLDGIMVTDANGVILSVNRAFTDITGYPAQEVIGQTPRLLRSNTHDQAFHAAVWQQIAQHGQWKGEIWNRRKNGETFPMWQAISGVSGKDGRINRYISVFHDVTEAWRMNERNRYLAFHDALTQLPNRALLMERLERQIVLAEREPRCLAVLFLDLDGFKRVNDTLGHAIGDELLKALAAKLLGLVRQTDTVARLGGDEFVVLLENPTNEDEVIHIAHRVISAINEPLILNGVTAKVGTSIGIALYPQHGQSAAEFLKNSDAAMYVAKQEGKNTYRLAPSKCPEI